MQAKEQWLSINEISDEEKIWAGTIIRLENVTDMPGYSMTNFDYLISYIFGNSEYLQLSCLTAGEAGNILCVLKKDLPNHYALGAELKRMLGCENVSVKFEF